MTQPDRRTIYKFVCTQPDNRFTLPGGMMRPIHVDFDTRSPSPAIWFELTEGTPDVAVLVHLVATGGTIPTGTEYVGSVQRNEIILHLYWRWEAVP